ncbi:MAG: hypothetical protein KAI25_10840, partial [Hyphomicrobiaceae bacterium]|nr:hypothetical protein [Hyphomicrobiaceae bacterium]
MTDTGHSGWLTATLTGLSVLLAASALAAGVDNEDANDAQSVIANFDMGELYQPLPKNFRRARGDEFYHWIRVALDRKIGHT